MKKVEALSNTAKKRTARFKNEGRFDESPWRHWQEASSRVLEALIARNEFTDTAVLCSVRHVVFEGTVAWWIVPFIRVAWRGNRARGMERVVGGLLLCIGRAAFVCTKMEK